MTLDEARALLASGRSPAVRHGQTGDDGWITSVADTHVMVLFFGCADSKPCEAPDLAAPYEPALKADE